MNFILNNMVKYQEIIDLLHHIMQLWKKNLKIHSCEFQNKWFHKMVKFIFHCTMNMCWIFNNVNSMIQEYPVNSRIVDILHNMVKYHKIIVLLHHIMKLWNKNFKIYSCKFLDYWFHNMVKFIIYFTMCCIDSRKILVNSCSFTLPYTHNARETKHIWFMLKPEVVCTFWEDISDNILWYDEKKESLDWSESGLIG